MTLTEPGEHQDDDDDHDAGRDYKGLRLIGEGEIDVHAVDAGDEREGQHDDGDDGEDAHDLVDAVAGESIGSIGEAVDDFEVLVGDVAELEEVVDDIAKILLHMLVQDGVVDGFELLDDGDLPADDAAEGDDIAAQEGELLDDAFGVRLEEGVFNGVDAPVDLVEDGEDVVHKLVDEGVEGVVGAASEQTLALVGGRLAAFEGGYEGLERPVVDGDDVVWSEEEIHLAGAGELVAGIPEREVHDEEEVVVVLVELGAFDGADDVFEVEGVEAGEAPPEGIDVFGGGVDDVDPGRGVVVDDAGCHGGYYGMDFHQRVQRGNEVRRPISQRKTATCRSASKGPQKTPMNRLSVLRQYGYKGVFWGVPPGAGGSAIRLLMCV